MRPSRTSVAQGGCAAFTEAQEGLTILFSSLSALTFLSAAWAKPTTTRRVDLSKADNVLDRWIMAATVTLTRSVKEEMEAYRLYNVVPQLLTFIEQLTNIYVRFNRKRLKGGNGPTDTIHALGTLYHVLVTLCKVRRPLHPTASRALTNSQPFVRRSRVSPHSSQERTHTHTHTPGQHTPTNPRTRD